MLIFNSIFVYSVVFFILYITLGKSICQNAVNKHKPVTIYDLWIWHVVSDKFTWIVIIMLGPAAVRLIYLSWDKQQSHKTILHNQVNETRQWHLTSYHIALCKQSVLFTIRINMLLNDMSPWTIIVPVSCAHFHYKWLHLMAWAE